MPDVHSAQPLPCARERLGLASGARARLLILLSASNVKTPTTLGALDITKKKAFYYCDSCTKLLNT